MFIAAGGEAGGGHPSPYGAGTVNLGVLDTVIVSNAIIVTTTHNIDKTVVNDRSVGKASAD